MDQPGKVVNPARGQLNRESNISQRSRLRTWSRNAGSAVPSRVSLPISSILRLYGMTTITTTYSGWIWCLLTGFLPSSAAASIIYFKPPYVIGSVPSLLGYAIAYWRRSLPRVRRHRASKPQDSCERVLPWHIKERLLNKGLWIQWKKKKAKKKQKKTKRHGSERKYCNGNLKTPGGYTVLPDNASLSRIKIRLFSLSHAIWVSCGHLEGMPRCITVRCRGVRSFVFIGQSCPTISIKPSTAKERQF